jgi:CBS domain-containing protein
VKIEEIMSEELIVGYVPGTVQDALRVLAKYNVSGMPILKKDTKTVVGVLTRQDIFKNADEEQLALIMSDKVITVDKNQDIKDAANLLFKHRIHGLPVVNKRKNLVGIISPTEIIKTFTKKDDPIENFVSNLVVPIYEDTPINVPILNDHLKVSGIVTDGDLFKLSHIKESISRSDFGIGSDEDQWTWEGIRDTVRLYYSTTEVSLPPVAVKEVMISNVIKAYKNTTVSEVAESMIKNNISHIPIVTATDRLIGMVTDIDLMACIL